MSRGAGRPRSTPFGFFGDLPLGHLGSLGKHSSVIFIGNLLSRGVSVLLVPAMTGLLVDPTAQFAYWETMLMASMFISMVAAHGVTAALMWTLKTGGHLQRGELTGARRDEVIAAAVGWAGLASLVICGLCVAFATPLARLTTERPEHALTLALLVAAQALHVVTYPAEGVLKLRFQTIPIVFMSVGEFLVTGLGSIAALWWFDAGLLGMAWAALLGSALRLALGFVYLPEMRRLRLDWGISRGLVRYGLPLMPGAVASIIVSLSDRRFFIYFGMDEAGGIYAFGDKWARMIEFLLITPLLAMWPAVFFNIAREADGQKQFARIASLFAAVGGGLAFAITIMGPAITYLLDFSQGKAFAGAASSIGVLCVGYVLFGLNEVARVGFQVTGRTVRTAFAMIFAAALNLLLNALLIPPFGAVGAGVATLLSYGGALILSLWLSRSVYPQRWEVGPLLHVTLLYVGAAWLLGALLPDDTWTGFGLRLLAAVGVPCLLLVTGFLRPDERRALAETLRGLRARIASSA